MTDHDCRTCIAQRDEAIAIAMQRGLDLTAALLLLHKVLFVYGDGMTKTIREEIDKALETKP